MTAAYFGEVVELFDGQIADAESIEFEYLHGTKPATLFVTGDLGGGTITVLGLAPNDVYVPLSDVSITEPGMYTIQTGAFSGKVKLAGATGADATVYIRGSVRVPPAV